MIRGKTFSLVLILILAMSLFIIAQSVSAQTTPKPSVPKFTVRYVDYSYDIPPVYGIDQYTGQNTIIQAGYHVDNSSIEFTIKNQPFQSYNDTNGNYNTLYYNFRFKGQYGDSWSNYPDLGHSYGRFSGLFPDVSASNSDYTVISIPLLALTAYATSTHSIPMGVKVDFQVQAIMGYISSTPTGMLAGDFFSFEGNRSDWSNTQTVTLGNTALSSSTPTSTASSPIPTPTVPEFSWLVILPLFAAMLFFAVILRHRKIPNLKQ